MRGGNVQLRRRCGCDADEHVVWSRLIAAMDWLTAHPSAAPPNTSSGRCAPTYTRAVPTSGASSVGSGHAWGPSDLNASQQIAIDTAA
jgi:hypothetical protein